MCHVIHTPKPSVVFAAKCGTSRASLNERKMHEAPFLHKWHWRTQGLISHKLTSVVLRVQHLERSIQVFSSRAPRHSSLFLVAAYGHTASPFASPLQCVYNRESDYLCITSSTISANREGSKSGNASTSSLLALPTSCASVSSFPTTRNLSLPSASANST